LGDNIGQENPHFYKWGKTLIHVDPLMHGTERRLNLTLTGKLYVENRIIRESASADNDEGQNFRDKLEMCLIDLCAGLEIPVPLWLKKNTRELAIFRKTFFSSEQFIDKVWFDKFEIKLG